MKHLFFLFFAVFCISNHCLAQTNSSFREIRLFIDADQSLVDKAGGKEQATSFVQELVAKVDAIYRNQLGITITLAGLHLWESEDPFLRTGTSASLASFANYAEQTYRSQFNYDVAHLLMGSGLGGEGGIAYQGSACGDIFSATQAYGVSQPDINDQYEFNAHLLAHELGHNLNAEHDPLPACALKTIMCLAQIGSDFSDQSKSEISSYVNSRLASACFPLVTKSNPIEGISLKVAIKKADLSYKIAGAQNCTSLSLVASPSSLGLKTTFAYLPLSKLPIRNQISAISKNPLALKSRKNKIFFGVYCDGQLASSQSSLNLSKIKSKKATTSSILVLRSLQKGFKLQR